MDRRNWLLLLLGVAPEDQPPPVDRVRAMKCLFILGERLPRVKEGGYYHFRPYNYGPFDSAVYRDAEDLVADGLALEVPAGGHTAYQATWLGLQRAADLAVAHPEAAAYLRQLRQWANRVDFATLLKAVYAEWPEYGANSIFAG